MAIFFKLNLSVGRMPIRFGWPIYIIEDRVNPGEMLFDGRRFSFSKLTRF